LNERRAKFFAASSISLIRPELHGWHTFLACQLCIVPHEPGDHSGVWCLAQRLRDDVGALRKAFPYVVGPIVGYSRLMGADEEGTLAALKVIRRELVDPGS
jgi:hypothetical protein